MLRWAVCFVDYLFYTIILFARNIPCPSDTCYIRISGRLNPRHPWRRVGARTIHPSPPLWLSRSDMITMGDTPDTALHEPVPSSHSSVPAHRSRDTLHRGTLEEYSIGLRGLAPQGEL